MSSKVTIRRKNQSELQLEEPVIPSKGGGRQTGFKKNVPLSKFIPFFGNDPDRTNRALADFQDLVESHCNGGLRGPIRAAYDPLRDLYFIINGHRTVEASKDAGFDSIDVNTVYANPGETAEFVQKTLFALDNLNRPYKGKAMLRTAILTNGEILMSPDIKRVWGIIQKHIDNPGDLNWLAVQGAPELVKITERVVTYMVLARMKEGLGTSFQTQKSFFVTAMYILKNKEVQKETRDYVSYRMKTGRSINRELESMMMNNGTVPACIFTDQQKNRAKKLAETAKAKKAKKNGAKA